MNHISTKVDPLPNQVTWQVQLPDVFGGWTSWFNNVYHNEAEALMTRDFIKRTYPTITNIRVLKSESTFTLIP
jgi:hypothetical protein